MQQVFRLTPQSKNPPLTKQKRLLMLWCEALETPAFKARHIQLTDLASALVEARRRSFQRLLQALLREGLLDGARISDTTRDRVLALGDGCGHLLLEGLRQGGMASWWLDGTIVLRRTDGVQHEVEFPSDLLLLVVPLLTVKVNSADAERLGAELDDSLFNDTLCLAYHTVWNRDLSAVHAGRGLLPGLRASGGPANPSVLLEQWGTLGHPWHPNYKTKLGLSIGEAIAYSPEFGAEVAVEMVALRRDVAHVETLAGADSYLADWRAAFPLPAERFDTALRKRGLSAKDYLPLLAHPWQVREVLRVQFVDEIARGELVLLGLPAFTGHATMSFRTVQAQPPATAPMIKLPVGLRLTSVQRTVSPRSATMGPRVSALLQTLLAREPAVEAVLSILPERHGVHYAPQPADDERARHLGMLWRDNPLSGLRPGELAMPVGCLFGDTAAGRPLLAELVAAHGGKDDADSLCTFYRHYTRVALDGLLALYLVYGVAFEAHQQNSLVVLDAQDRPLRLLLRDFGDIRIHRATLEAHGLSLTLHDPAMTLIDDADFVREKLLHTGLMCHLGELALLGARLWPVEERVLWGILARNVAACFERLRPRVDPDRWQIERHAFLEAPWPAKAFLRMRLLDTREDIVGRLPNPLTGLV